MNFQEFEQDVINEISKLENKKESIFLVEVYNADFKKLSQHIIKAFTNKQSRFIVIQKIRKELNEN